MSNRIKACIGTHGSGDAVSMTALMSALSDGEFVHEIWESQEFWELRMEWLNELSELLAVSWDAQLTFRLKDTLNLSQDKIDQLRYSLSHHRVGKRLVPRPWAINPWTGKKLNFPQPIKQYDTWRPFL